MEKDKGCVVAWMEGVAMKRRTAVTQSAVMVVVILILL
jgi:hypothetical protein